MSILTVEPEAIDRSLEVIDYRRDVGVATLDRHFAGELWRPRIDVRSLMMRSGNLCVVGQLLGSYNLGVSRLVEGAMRRGDLRGILTLDPNWWATERGFLTDMRLPSEDERERYWDALQDAWVRLLKG